MRQLDDRVLSLDRFRRRAAATLLGAVVSLGGLAVAMRGEAAGGEKDPPPIPSIYEDGYPWELENVDPQSVTRQRVTLEARVVPDAYRYLLAKRTAELQDAGYEDERIRTEIRKYHAKIRRYENKVLFLVEISVPKDTGCFVLTSLQRHVRLTQKRKKTHSVQDEKPKPSWAKWKLFEYPWLK